MSLSRRRFQQTALGTAGGLALMAAAVAPRIGAAAGSRTAFSNETHFLELDGTLTRLLSADGGYPRGEVVLEGPPRPGAPVAKRIAGPRFTELDVGLSLPDLPKAVTDWIGAFLNGVDVPRSGALVTADVNAQERERLSFKDAVLTEVGLDAFDAGARTVGALSLRMLPSFAQPAPGRAGVTLPPLAASRQRWLSSNFRLRIKGLEDACARVVRIEPLLARRVPVQTGVETREAGRAGGFRLDPPNLIITLADNAAPFYEWFADFVLRGNNDASRELPGALDVLAPDLTQVLATVSFANLGIYACAPEPASETANARRRVRVEMYCERMTLAFGAGAAAGPLLAPGRK